MSINRYRGGNLSSNDNAGYGFNMLGSCDLRFANLRVRAWNCDSLVGCDHNW